MMTFVNLDNKSPADGFEGVSVASKPAASGLDLAALLKN
jgi:hypothetical protein